RRDLRERRKRLDVIDLQVGLAIPRHLHEVDQARGALHRVALKELLTADAIGRAHERAGAPGEVAHHPGTDGLEIPRESELRYGLPGAVIGPERFVGFRDRHAHDREVARRAVFCELACSHGSERSGFPSGPALRGGNQRRWRAFSTASKRLRMPNDTSWITPVTQKPRVPRTPLASPLRICSRTRCRYT